MTLITDKIRRLEKTSNITGEKPTLPPSSDHTDGSWGATDAYDRELFLNTVDGKIYTRYSGDVIAPNTENGILSGLEVINGSDAVNFTIQAGIVRVQGREITYSLTSDAVTIAAGDATNGRFDIVTIDVLGTAQVTEGVPAASPVIPTVPTNQTLLATLFVPANHISSSPFIEPLAPSDLLETKRNTIKDWATGKTLLKGMYINNSGALYRVLVNHISGVFATDLSNSYLDVVGVSSGSDLATTLATGNNTGANDIIVDTNQSIFLGSALEGTLKYKSIGTVVELTTSTASILFQSTASFIDISGSTGVTVHGTTGGLTVYPKAVFGIVQKTAFANTAVSIYGGNNLSSDYSLIAANNSSNKILQVRNDKKILINDSTCPTDAALSMGFQTQAQKLLVYNSGNFRMGLGIATNELRFFRSSGNSGFMTWGNISTSDGTTYNEIIRLWNQGDMVISGGRGILVTDSSAERNLHNTIGVYNTSANTSIASIAEADLGFILKNKDTTTGNLALISWQRASGLGAGVFGAQFDQTTGYADFIWANKAGVNLSMILTSDAKLSLNDTVTIPSVARVSFGASNEDQKLLMYNNGNTRAGIGIPASEFRIFASTVTTNGITFGAISNGDGVTFTEKMRLDIINNNLMFGTTVVGTNGTWVFSHKAGTAPIFNPAGISQMFVDAISGSNLNVCHQFRNEQGDVVKLYKEAALTAEDTGVVNSGDATTDGVINNIRTRLGELELRLQTQGLLV